MKKFEKLKKKKKFRFWKKKFRSDTDTEIEPWFRFLIPKPGFGCTLPHHYLPPDFQMFLRPCQGPRDL